ASSTQAAQGQRRALRRRKDRHAGAWAPPSVAAPVATTRGRFEFALQRGATDLVEFMERVAERCPGHQIHVVWDNLNIHFDGAVQRWTRFNRRHGGRLHFHYTPIAA